MQLRLLRHATVVLQMGTHNLLVDPMLSPKGVMGPVNGSPNMRPNPLVDLPVDSVDLDGLLKGITGVLVTHTHRDHFDAEAERLILKNTPLFCQPQDENMLTDIGFNTVFSVEDTLTRQDITITRTGGKHGSGEIGQKMGAVSGFILEAKNEPKVYIAGDTIWCVDVRQALEEHRPDIVIVNAGRARFLLGGRITMSVCDIGHIAKQLPSARIVAVHMEAFNHCLLTRRKLREYVIEHQLTERVLVPEDGEEITF